ncbi:MAG: hypothetical protein O7A09_08855 [Proteobacteria bacterium]|nr:hypothetical protein [Pseudomonadota bacterium]
MKRRRRRINWSFSAPGVRDPVERWLRERKSSEAPVLARGTRREVVRLADQPGLVVKRFAPWRVPGAPWKRILHALRTDPAEREWRHQTWLHDAGVPVPPPLGRALLRRGARILVSGWVEGEPLDRALELPPRRRRQVMTELGQLVARLHACGVAHGDLHVGNVLVGDKGLVVLDLQRARSGRPGARGFERRRLRDLGGLDFSLALAGFSRPDRLRMRAAALGLEDRRSEAARRALRAVGRSSQAMGQRYYRSRTRRSLRPGRLYARLEVAGWRGLRLRRFAADDARTALCAHVSGTGSDAEIAADVLKSDPRSRITGVAVPGARVVVKEVRKKGPGRRLADLFRGSPARRAWVAGHGLAARGIAAATPLAFLERRRLGIPVASVVLLEDLRPAPAANEPGPEPADLCEALLELALQLHRRQVIHGDLQALHVYLVPRDGSVHPTLIDLEGVRFRSRLRDRDRLRALAELNASLADDRIPPRERRRAFARSCRALPFRAGERGALREVVRLSRARHHAWRGDGCDG